ncbi:MAG TPA: sigma-54 dependent transcriptional regulator [Candidatus Methylomirabilis sp.]|nr:sigma-54 dependent transcriptional regulator [Candidatus Methylomirabilis sp.]
MAVVLVVDDEPLQCDILKTILDADRHETYTAASGAEALSLAARLLPDVILTDLKMPGMDGIELLERLPEEPFKPSIIIMTAHGTISSAVEAVKKGAFEYLTKPLQKDPLLLTVRRAAERARLLKENLHLQRELYGRFRMEGILGRSEKMRQVMELVRRVCTSSATVCLTGESGTGKELVARAIHYNSARRAKPFTSVNCSAIAESLFESELFGHEAGAFTGASARKEGLFEISEGGTLFLDEIGDLPLAMQPKLLRAIQEKEIRRVGGQRTLAVEVRILAATNKDLQREMAAGRFREDLFYRLTVMSIHLPPLRERKEDLGELVEYFLQKYAQQYGRKLSGVEPAVLKAFEEYAWPGNIRELAAVMERAVLMSEGSIIALRDVQGQLRCAAASPGLEIELPDEGIDFETLEKELLAKAMAKAGGMATRAAKLLGMSYKTFLYRLEKYQIRQGPS